MKFKSIITFRIITYKKVECIYDTDNNNNKVYEKLEEEIEKELDEKGFDFHTIVIDEESEMIIRSEIK